MNRTLFLVTLVLLAGKAQAQDSLVEYEVRGSGYEVVSPQEHLAPISEIFSEPVLYTTEQLNDSMIQRFNTKDPIIAWILSFPAGFIGLHRAYLGSPKTMLLYIATVGGVFGIVPMIDWILLLKGVQEGDISQFEGNQRFLMWRTSKTGPSVQTH